MSYVYFVRPKKKNQFCCLRRLFSRIAIDCYSTNWFRNFFANGTTYVRDKNKNWKVSTIIPISCFQTRESNNNLRSHPLSVLNRVHALSRFSSRCHARRSATGVRVPVPNLSLNEKLIRLATVLQLVGNCEPKRKLVRTGEIDDARRYFIRRDTIVTTSSLQPNRAPSCVRIIISNLEIQSPGIN